MKSSRSIPTAAGTVPFLGHGVKLIRGPLTFLSSLPAQGDLVRIRLGPIPAVVACTPELVHQILFDDRTFDKGGPFFDRAGEVAGNGLATCGHADHRRLRRHVQPAFHRNRIRKYADAMAAHIAASVDCWQDGQVIDVATENSTLASTVVLDVLFSDALPAVTLRQMIGDLTTVVTGIYWQIVLPPAVRRLPIPANVRYHRAYIRLRRTLDALIAHRRTERVDRGDMLSALLRAETATSPQFMDDDGDYGTRGATVLSDRELSDQVITLFGAGAETTAATLTWALYLVARHPDTAQRLHAETAAVLNGAPAQFDHLPQLDVARRIITETLRLYPPGWLLSRSVTSDTELAEYTIPAGTVVMYSPYLLHHRSDLYRDPERFDPDRWISQPAAGSRSKSLIPFGAGPRKCIGDQFAVTEATLALATIASRCDLHLTSSDPVRIRLGGSLRPHRLPMRVARKPT